MKQGKTLIILLVIAALLFGGYFALSAMNRKNEQDKAEQEEEIVLFEAESLTALSFEGLEFIKEAGTGLWLYPADPTFPLSQTELDALEAGALRLAAARLVEDSRQNDAAYGLDEPDITFSLTDKNGVTVTCQVGDLNSFTFGYYARVNDDDAVYLLSESPVESFRCDLPDLVQKETIPAILPENLTSIEIVSPAGSRTLKPDDAEAQSLLSAICSLSQDEIAAWQVTDFAKYGLSGGAETVYTVHYQGVFTETGDDGQLIEKLVPSVFTLTTGTEALSGGMYVRVGDSSNVFVTTTAFPAQ